MVAYRPYTAPNIKSGRFFLLAVSESNSTIRGLSSSAYADNRVRLAKVQCAQVADTRFHFPPNMERLHDFAYIDAAIE